MIKYIIVRHTHICISYMIDTIIYGFRSLVESQTTRAEPELFHSDIPIGFDRGRRGEFSFLWDIEGYTVILFNVYYNCIYRYIMIHIIYTHYNFQTPTVWLMCIFPLSVTEIQPTNLYSLK